MRIKQGVGLLWLLSAGTALAAPPRTLSEALALTYSTNPTILAERATLRANDEGVPQALAGWRPTVTLQGNAGYANTTLRVRNGGQVPINGVETTVPATVSQNSPIATMQATVTQYLYKGGATRAGTNRAENAVMTERAHLMSVEQKVFTDAVNAYVNVIQRQQLLDLQINNERVLQHQLDATQKRFQVGDITRTDVEQARAALAGAQATRDAAEGSLATARASYQQIVGALPDRLVPPQPINVPVVNAQAASSLASHNNPDVVAAEFNMAAAKDAVDGAFAALMPNVYAQAQGMRQDNPVGSEGERIISAQATLGVSIPIYQGGSEYSKIRQAKQQQQNALHQLEDQRRTAISTAAQTYETLVADRATVDSTRAQIHANEIALQGVEREAIVGSRTTLDVLNAQQALLNSQVTLVQNLTQMVEASYQLAAAVGRLTARDMQLPVAYYDETAYYHSVRNALWGVDDEATDQPNR